MSPSRTQVARSTNTEPAGLWRRARICLVFATAIVLVSAAPSLAAEGAESSGWSRANEVGRAAFDLAILRPLQVVQVAVSAVVFLPAYPTSLLFDGGEDVLELCITEPVHRAFRRPLGEL